MCADLPPDGDAAALYARVLARYAGAGRAAGGYIAGKLRRDPVHRDMLALAIRENFGEVLDLGCGRGQLGILLLEAGAASAVLGVDRNAALLDQASRAARGLRFQTVRADFAGAVDLPSADTVLIIDVLYQLDTPARDALLGAAVRAARQRILVRTLDPARGWRSAFTIALERALRPLSPHSGAHVNPPPVDRLVALLAGEGFAVTVAPCWRGTPFANVLMVGRRSPLNPSMPGG
jgi:SAM-dependent methyltransferase